MSRLKRFTLSLASGYLQTGVNVVYTLVSVRLALHYLTTEEFGLWQVAITIAGYLLLMDFGMTGASARILIDHKDTPNDGAYGSVIKISAVVLLIQGFLIAVVGTTVSFFVPQLLGLPPQFHRILFFLAAGQCVLQGIFFASRTFWNLGVAHQRYDIYNFAQAGMFVVQLAALWLAFREGAGVYSILAASGSGLFFAFCCGWIAAMKMGYLPARGCWGKFDWKLFKEIFFFGGDQFLMVIGNQLIYASQVLIVSHTLGLTAAAVWSVATKAFAVAQQLVTRIFDFSTSALSEMHVRGERERFIRRLGDVVIFSAVGAIFIFGCAAFCNESFLRVWLKKPEMLAALGLNWSPVDDFLLAVWFATATISRCNVGLTGVVKQIGRMRYVYFLEGVTFVIAALLDAPRFGIAGIICAAILADVVWSGFYGIWRTSRYAGISMVKIIEDWLARPAIYSVLFALILIASRSITEQLASNTIRLTVNATISGLVGIVLLWLVALTGESRSEMKNLFARAKGRLFGHLGL